MDLEELAARSHRVVTTAAMESIGLDRNAITRLRRDGRLIRLFQRTYAVPPVTEPGFTVACRGGVTFAGAGATVIGESALALRSPYPEPRSPEVGVPRSRHVRGTPGLWLTHCAPEMLHGAELRDGVRVQETGLAVVWAWSRLRDPRDRQAVLCAAGSATTGAVRRAVDALPRVRDRAALLDTCGHVDSGCASPAEIAYLLDVERGHGLPSGQRQAAIHVPGDRVRRVDVRYGRVVVEIDGGHHRTDPAQRVDDAARDVVLRALGLHVVRIRADDVHRSPALVAATVRAALAAA